MTRSIVPNRTEIVGNVMRIHLWPEGCQRVALIDATDYPLVEEYAWRLRAPAEERMLWLGVFLTEEEAALAYNRAALVHFGEFACLDDLTTPSG